MDRYIPRVRAQNSSCEAAVRRASDEESGESWLWRTSISVRRIHDCSYTSVISARRIGRSRHRDERKPPDVGYNSSGIQSIKRKQSESLELFVK